MSRKQKLILNTFTGIIKQVVTVICGFILPRYMLLYYGSSINGLISSISNFLGFISLLDMGVGAVIQANLYKPLANNDTGMISQIVVSSERFFRRLAYIFIGYIIVLCFLFPILFDSKYEVWFIVSLLIIISISTLVQYLYGMTYQLLLNADQKSYIPLLLQIFTIMANTIFAVILMKLGMPVHIVKLMTAAVYVLRPLLQMAYVRNHYAINRKIKVVGEPIKQKWNGFSQHFAAVVCQNIDIVVLTVFSTLEEVSIYSVYYSVINGVQQIIMTAATGLEALFGNMIARGEKDKLLDTFTTVEWAVHSVVTFVFEVTAFTIIPFVSVYTKGIIDANYIAPAFAAVLVIAYGVQCLRIPYFRIIKAAGHFKQTQNGAYISAGLNIIITVGLVFKFGLIGTAIGTFVAMFYHTSYFAWYLNKNILNRPIKYYLQYICVDCLTVGLTYFIAKNIQFDVYTYFEWAKLATVISVIAIAVSACISLLFYRKYVYLLTRLLKKKTR